MERLLKQTRNKYIAFIVLIIVAVVSISWGILQIYNQREIAAPANISEVHQSANNNEAFAEYLEAEKEYEAHFLTLASSIKEQESERVTRALAVTAVITIIAGVIIAFFVARWLMKPVKEAYESQERFIQDAAHELRNPLAAMAAALQQAKPAEQKSPLVMTFRRQTKRLININEDLLFLERSRRQTPENTYLSELLLDVVEELQPLAMRKKVTINTDTDDNIIKTIAPSDYVRLVKNIIDNAVKYSKTGGNVEVSQKKDKHHIYITVVDHGIGIPEKDTIKVGDRFYRASNVGEVLGTGLGLAIVRKILNIYGGSFDIDSKPNKGTKVTIHLPA